MRGLTESRPLSFQSASQVVSEHDAYKAKVEALQNVVEGVMSTLERLVKSIANLDERVTHMETSDVFSGGLVDTLVATQKEIAALRAEMTASFPSDDEPLLDPDAD